MKSLADGLPPEIARQIYPDWRKNEAAYWAVRAQLLGQYQGQWIGFADGVVVASGTRPVVVFHAAHQAAAHPYVICVGREEEPYRMRRANFAYDTSYPGEASPVIRPTSGASAASRVWCSIRSSPTRVLTPAPCLGRTAKRCNSTQLRVCRV
ncbi:MAG TPA: hypothetical protein VG013_37330 [Gemmataceae bacterium]|jgi:hypothetical protein|nr:hypothetical protein [Gemmataceae bacterium]